MIELSHSQAQSVGLDYVLQALEPSSPYGAALARRPRFYGPGERAELAVQLQNVFSLLNARETLRREGTLDKLARLLMQLKDIRRTAERCADAPLGELELFELKRFLLQLELIAPLAARVREAAGLAGMEINALPEALGLLSDGTKGATFYIPDNKSEGLAAARKKKRELELAIRQETRPARMDELRAERTAAAAAEDAEESRLRAEVSRALRPYLAPLADNMDAIAGLDFTVARAELAAKYGGALPELAEGGDIVFRDMINPRVMDALRGQGREFTPVSVTLSPGAAVVTGANMGGKSVALKTLALNVLMVHIGLLPTAGAARLPLLDGLFMVSEDLENADRGLSSFGAEIVRFNEVLLSCGERAMILLDEFARGTNPYEGASIVRAVTAYLNTLGHYSLLTTHYDGVAGCGNRHYQVVGLRDMDLAAAADAIAAGEDGVKVIAACMDYGLFEVGEDAPCPRDALNICRLLGLNGEILKNI